jgi:UDP:flavonoid glycosyltransferase YjiC (YdhE family)
MRRLKVARVIRKANYTPMRVASTLKAMLAEPFLAERARTVAQQLSREDGVKSACDALEELYQRARKVQ